MVTEGVGLFSFICLVALHLVLVMVGCRMEQPVGDSQGRSSQWVVGPLEGAAGGW